MSKIVLLSCVKSKKPHPAPAGVIYTSDLFRKALVYAQSLHPDRIFILSAEHGLLDPDQRIEPYEKSLNTMGAAERKAWAERVLARLSGFASLQDDDFVILAGKRYREHLVSRMRHVSIPLEGLGIGKQLSWYKKNARS